MIEGKNMECPREQVELKSTDQLIKEQTAKFEALNKELDAKNQTGNGRSEKEIMGEMQEVGKKLDRLHADKKKEEEKSHMFRR